MHSKNISIEKQWFVRALLEGDTQLNASAINQLSSQLGIANQTKPYYCIVAKLKSASPSYISLDASVCLYEACRDAGKALKYEMYTYPGAKFHVVMMVEDCHSKKMAAVERIMHFLTKNCSCDIQLGVGKSYTDLEKMAYSRVEAYEALANIEENSSISYINDFYASRSITTRKLEANKRKVVDYFKSGQFDSMAAEMIQLVEKVRIESPVREGLPYPTSIRRTVVELFVEIMHISADAGVDVDAVLPFQDPYRQIFEIEGTPGILAWFMDATRLLYDNIKELSNKTENKMLSYAKIIINRNIHDPQLSLSLVSEELGLSATYFSAFFIREVGIGFNEYITNIRIEKAKQLLLATTKKVNIIATECGFRSASYFISVFRKHMGMSPGEYRKQK